MVDPLQYTTFLNGEFMVHEKAVAALQEEETQAAGGYYDHERTFNGKVFKLRLHLERLYRGLEYSKVDPRLTLEEMETVTLQIIDANWSHLGPGEELMVTQVVNFTPAASEDEEDTVNVIVFCQPMDFAKFAGNYLRGVRIATPATYSIPHMSSTTRLDIEGRQVYLLMANREGSITECVGGNFMFIREGRIKLPDRSNVLPGVSMHTILELAESLDIAVDEGDYSAYDVYQADEAFVSNTRSCMLPVTDVNGLQLNPDIPGPVTNKLLEAWKILVGLDFVQQALDSLPPGDAASWNPEQGE